MKHWYATFGHGQTHPLTGENLMDCYTLVPGDTRELAQGLMMQSVFGAGYAFLYEYADGLGGAGVERYGMRLVEFIPPSPLSSVVWRAVESFPQVSLAQWVDYVAQPIEVAWYRSIEARDAVRILDEVDRAVGSDRSDRERSFAESSAIYEINNQAIELAEAASPLSDRSATSERSQLATATIDVDETNDFLVSRRGDQIEFSIPIRRPITVDEALRTAAHLATIADPGGERFAAVLEAVRS